LIKSRYIFIVFLLAVIMNSCKKENLYDCFKVGGKDETRIRELSGFKKVIVEDKIDVHILQGPFYEVKVEAGKNLHINIKTQIRDSGLFISNHNRCNFLRSPKKRIKVYITMPRLNYIENNGVGTVYFDNQMKTDTIRTNQTNSGDIFLNAKVGGIRTSTHGNGDLHIQGHTVECFNYTNGTNYLYLEGLTIQNYIFIETYSIGHCYINAPLNGPIGANIWSRGNIYYKGNPTSIDFEQHDKGTVIKE
jgi:hypothetical protein